MSSGSRQPDKGKKGKGMRMAVDLDRKPKARTKSRIPKRKPGYKRRKS